MSQKPYESANFEPGYQQNVKYITSYGTDSGFNADDGVIVRGYENVLNKKRCLVLDGDNNTFNEVCSKVFIGDNNQIDAKRVIVIAGNNNKVSGEKASLYYGHDNVITAKDVAVHYGSTNNVTGLIATIHHGNRNTVSSQEAVLVHGNDNQISGLKAIIHYGNTNTVSAKDAVIIHGDNNNLSAQNASVIHGNNNTVSAKDACVALGNNNEATHPYSVGHSVHNEKSGIDSEVFTNYIPSDIKSSKREFLLRGQTIPGVGCILTVDGTSNTPAMLSFQELCAVGIHFTLTVTNLAFNKITVKSGECAFIGSAVMSGRGYMENPPTVEEVKTSIDTSGGVFSITTLEPAFVSVLVIANIIKM